MSKPKKLLAIVLCVAMLVCVLPMGALTASAATVKNGWVNDSGDWYYYQDGEMICDKFITAGGNTYFLNYDGKMETGFIYYNGKYLYANLSGAIVKNSWIKENNRWCYAKSNGELAQDEWIGNYYFSYIYMADGVTYTDNQWGWCIFDSNGTYRGRLGSQSGWQFYDGVWYYYQAPYCSYTGWLKSGGDWYYIDKNTMVYGDIKSISGKSYYLDYDGRMRTGWIKDNDGRWYYANQNGELSRGWDFIGGKWYYFEEVIVDGAPIGLFTGLPYQMVDKEIRYIHMDEKFALFNKDGSWIRYIDSEWYKDSNGDWYYPCERTSNGWEQKRLKISDKEYYFSGAEMITNGVCFNEETGNKFYVDKIGNIDIGSGWRLASNGGWYYLENGVLADGLKYIGGKYYHFGWYSSCMMDTGLISVYNEQTDDYDYMFFDSSGARQSVSNGWCSAVNYKGDTEWYYVVNGEPINEEWHTISGRDYHFDYNGKMDNVGLFDGYLYDINGYLAKNEWIYSTDILDYGGWYYADSNGKPLIGEHTIGGQKYWFDINGIWIK